MTYLLCYGTLEIVCVLLLLLLLLLFDIFTETDPWCHGKENLAILTKN